MTIFPDRRLFWQLARQRLTLACILATGILEAAALLAQAFLLSYMIHGIFLVRRAPAELLPFLIGFAVAGLVRSAARYGQMAVSAQLARKVKTALRENLIEKIRRAGPFPLKQQKTGDLSVVLTQGIDRLDPFFSQYLPQLILTTCIPLLILLFVFPLDALTGFVFLFSAPLIPIFMVLIGSTTEKMTRKQWTMLRILGGHFFEIIQGLPTLKLFNRSKEQIKQIARISDEYRVATLKILKIAFLSALVLELVATLSTAMVAVEIGLRLLYGKLIFREALFLLLLAPEFYQPLRQLGARFHAGAESVAAANTIFDTLSSLPQMPQGGKALCDLRHDPISFQEVSYDYPDQPEIIRNFTFTFPPGKMIAIVGSSGAGKSTLLSLLQAFVSPTSGNIQVGDKRLADLDLRSYRQQIAVVPQHPYLFPWTLRENLKLFCSRPDGADLEDILKRTALTGIVKTLPHGLDTPLGELANRLSGGEAQRVALARALLSPANLFIFDEPTANLDLQTEQIISETISDLKKEGKRLIVVAHRLETIKQADQILVLKGGQLVESGTHEELLKMNGIYAGYLLSKKETVA